MIILAFATALPVCAACLTRDGQVLAGVTEVITLAAPSVLCRKLY
jgi:hypothetical protein